MPRRTLTGLALLLASNRPALAEATTRKPAPVTGEPKECIVLLGKSGNIEDRCKQTQLQCGPQWYRKYCGNLIKAGLLATGSKRPLRIP